MKNFLEKAKNIFLKYDLNFWFSLIGKVILLTISIIFGFLYTRLHFGIASTYALIIIIRAPTFFWNKIITKKYDNDLDKLFRYKHIAHLYTSVVLITFLFVCVPLFNFSDTTPIDRKSIVIIFSIYVPWAIIRGGFEVFRVIKYRKVVDPYFRCKALINIYVASVAIVGTLVELGRYYNASFPLQVVIFVYAM